MSPTNCNTCGHDRPRSGSCWRQDCPWQLNVAHIGTSSRSTEIKPPLYPKLRVYTASKLRHATMWQSLRLEWNEIQFTSRWIDLIGKCPDKQEFAEVFWIQDLQDVRCSDVVLVYGTHDDVLVGALVEAGAAIAFGLFVIVIGDCSGYGTWQYHPHVLHANDFNHARIILAQLDNQIHPRLPGAKI